MFIVAFFIEKNTKKTMRNTKKTIDTKKTLWYSNINKNKENFVIKWVVSHYKKLLCSEMFREICYKL